MKRCLAGVLVLLIVLGLCGCNGKDPKGDIFNKNVRWGMDAAQVADAVDSADKLLIHTEALLLYEGLEILGHPADAFYYFPQELDSKLASVTYNFTESVPDIQQTTEELKKLLGKPETDIEQQGLVFYTWSFDNSYIMYTGDTIDILSAEYMQLLQTEAA